MTTTLLMTKKEEKKHSVVYSGQTEGGTQVSFYIPNELVPGKPEKALVTIDSSPPAVTKVTKVS